MPTASAFEYAVVRVVPHVEREEFLNAGVIVFCDALDHLEARVELAEARLIALAPDVDLGLVRRHLAAIPLLCAGGPAAGPIGQLPRRERFRWLVAPRSTIVQTSAPHAGLCEEPLPASASPPLALEAWLERLLDRVVRPPGREGALR